MAHQQAQHRIVSLVLFLFEGSCNPLPIASEKGLFQRWSQSQSGGSANYLVEAALGPKKQGNAIGNFLKGIFGDGEEGVSVSLPIQVVSENDGQYLILDAANQEPGFYTIALKITDQATGKTLEREQDLFLE